MNINEFQTEHREFCNRYNMALDLYYRCAEYIEDTNTKITDIDKYTPMLTKYSIEMYKLMEEYKTLSGIELSNRITLGGFILYDKVS